MAVITTNAVAEFWTTSSGIFIIESNGSTVFKASRCINIDTKIAIEIPVNNPNSDCCLLLNITNNNSPKNSTGRNHKVPIPRRTIAVSYTHLTLPTTPYV